MNAMERDSIFLYAYHLPVTGIEGKRVRKDIKVVATAVPSAMMSYGAQRVFEKWGVLDPVADAIGHTLKVHVTGGMAAWAGAVILFAVLVGLILALWWRKPDSPPTGQGQQPLSPFPPNTGRDSYTNNGVNEGNIGPTFN